MRVNADLFNNYLFEPQSTELRAFVRVFKGKLVRARNGWTYASYGTLPRAHIKDAVYFDKVAPKTRSFKTEQAWLTHLQLGIDAKTGNFLDASVGLKLQLGATVTRDLHGYKTNHIPQLLGLVPNAENKFTVITAFSGVYNFEAKYFYGQIEIQDVRYVWEQL